MNNKRKTKTNLELINLIQDLKIAGEKKRMWKDVAKRLEKPRSHWSAVNVCKIAKYAKDNETILVPGKVLGLGSIEKSMKVAAFSFSDNAYEKLLKSGSEAMTIEELLKTNPKAGGIRILG